MRTKPKKLTLRQIHELYLLLKPYLPEKEEKYLIDEVDAMLDTISDKDFMKALEIMYSKPSGNPLDLLLLLIKGLREKNFFEYALFLKGLKRG